jgi:hypothetical protein
MCLNFVRLSLGQLNLNNWLIRQAALGELESISKQTESRCEKTECCEQDFSVTHWAPN